MMKWGRDVNRPHSQEIRALLVARKQLLGRLLDVELSIRGILRGFGLKVGQVTRKTFEARIRELVTGQAGHVGANCWGDALGAGNFEGGVRETAQGCARDWS
jgi:transposase